MISGGMGTVRQRERGWRCRLPIDGSLPSVESPPPGRLPGTGTCPSPAIFRLRRLRYLQLLASCILSASKPHASDADARVAFNAPPIWVCWLLDTVTRNVGWTCKASKPLRRYQPRSASRLPRQAKVRSHGDSRSPRWRYAPSSLPHRPT